MANELHPLAVRVEPRADESGPGLLLRVAHANGLALRQLLHWTGVGSLAKMSQQEVRTLSHVTRLPVSWLLHSLPHEAPGGGVRRLRYLSLEWGAEQLRGPRPQVCIKCLEEASYVRAEWELAGIGVCLTHGTWLVDQCSHCRKAISWGRPSIRICTCGRFLQDILTDAPRPEAIGWSKAFVDGIRSDPPGRWALRGLPTWMDALSAGGVIDVLISLGLRDRPHQVLAANALRKSRDSRSEVQILMRGLLRAEEIDPSDRASLKRVEALIHEPGVIRMIKQGRYESDRAVALQLHQWMSFRERTGLSATGRRPQGQLNLFPQEAP